MIAIVLVTIPGLAYDARKMVKVTRSATVQYYLTSSDEQQSASWPAMRIGRTVRSCEP